MNNIRIPDSEFAQRAENVQKTMAQEGLDLLLCFSNEAEHQYVRYLSDYWPSFETAGVLIAPDKKPLLLIGPESMTFASDRARIKDIRRLIAFRESSEPEYPGEKLDDFNTVIEELTGGKGIKKIGIAGWALISATIFRALSDAVKKYGNVEIVSADALMNRLKEDKSNNELACMKRAAMITTKAFDYVLQNIRPGMTELQVRGLAASKMYELGAEGEAYPMWVLAGQGSNQAISRARNKVMQPGDMVMVQIGARYEGYASSIGRPVVMGKANKLQKDLITAGYTGYNAVIGTMKAGVNAGDVARAHWDAITKCGFADWLLYGPCHGTGLMEGESPWIEINSDYLLRENLTFCVDIFLGSNGKGIGLRIEDSVCVKENGVEKLSDYPRELFEI